MERRQIVDLTSVPDWRTWPVELIALFPPGTSGKVVVEHSPEHLAPYSPAVRELVDQYLRPCQNPNYFYDGPYANVEGIVIGQASLTIQTGVTSAFPYIASAWHHRDDPSQNTIRPLAVQVIIFDAETRNTMLVERRSAHIVDYPRKLSVLGGVLLPGENPHSGTCRCLLKWGIGLKPSQLVPLALTHEPADRIYCLVFTAKMRGNQIAEVVRNLTGKREVWAEPIVDYHTAIYDRLLTTRLGHVYGWNPLGYLAFVCGAFVRWKRGEEEIRYFLDIVHRNLQRRPYRYAFPMQKYLPRAK